MSYDTGYTEFYVGKGKTPVAPKRSWWLDCTTREEFMARHAQELPRLCPQPEMPKGGVVPTLRRF